MAAFKPTFSDCNVYILKVANKISMPKIAFRASCCLSQHRTNYAEIFDKITEGNHTIDNHLIYDNYQNYHSYNYNYHNNTESGSSNRCDHQSKNTIILFQGTFSEAFTNMNYHPPQKMKCNFIVENSHTKVYSVIREPKKLKIVVAPFGTVS